jgi:mRNA interferase MazF
VWITELRLVSSKGSDGWGTADREFDGTIASDMRKDFDGWNETKKRTDSRRGAPFYHEREVWWCTLGVNVGSEENGSGEEYRRPALILKGLSIETCLIVPLTTSAKDHPLRVAVGLIGGKEARAIRSQMRVIHTKRLVWKIEYLEIDTFEQIRKAARGML